jgi:hypothetical protein
LFLIKPPAAANRSQDAAAAPATQTATTALPRFLGVACDCLVIPGREQRQL